MTLRVMYSGAGAESIFSAYAEAFVQNFGSGKHGAVPEGDYCGRVLRGLADSDFLALTNQPSRRLVFLLDAKGVAGLVGRSGWEILTGIGYDRSTISRLVRDGTRFRLTLVPKVAMLPATWEHVLDLACVTYPDWRDRIQQSRQALITLSYNDIMSAGGVVASVRRFLDQTLNISRLYAGDGYTRHGNMSVFAEYVCFNQPLQAFDAWCQIEFPVEVP